MTLNSNINNLKIAFLYNIRHLYPDPNNPETFMEADYDDEVTIDWMLKHLKNIVKEVVPIEANEEAYIKLKELKGKIDLVFNYSESLKGKDRYAHIPAILEMLRIPYTGSRPLTESLVMNKTRAKDILIAKNVPTLPYQFLMSDEYQLQEDLKFPLIVKPADMGSSAGITNDSVVYNQNDLNKKLTELFTTFKNGVFIEPYLAGREFSIGLLGNPPDVFPIIEADHSKLPKKYFPIDSLEVKWLFEEESDVNHLICPAKISDSFKAKLKEISINTWNALDIYDYCRIDIRCDEEENPYVLEINSPCGLIPPEVSKTSYFPLAARAAGIEYEELLEKIIFAASNRYNLI